MDANMTRTLRACGVAALALILLASSGAHAQSVPQLPGNQPLAPDAPPHIAPGAIARPYAPPQALPPAQPPLAQSPSRLGFPSGSVGLPSGGTPVEGYSQSGRYLGARTYQGTSGDTVTAVPNPAGGVTYRDPQGNLVVSRPSVLGGEVIRDDQGNIISARPNINGGYTYSDGTGRTTFCRPSIGDKFYCQEMLLDPLPKITHPLNR